MKFSNKLPDSDSDPINFGMDPDPDPAIFVSDLQDINKRLFCFVCLGCFAYYFQKVHLHHFSKIKSHEEVTKR